MSWEMSWKIPVSIKGILFKDNNVILLKNERKEWELPGGRLERVDVWVYEPVEGRHVLIVPYLCKCFPVAEIDGVNLPRGYRDSIRKAWKHVV